MKYIFLFAVALTFTNLQAQIDHEKHPRAVFRDGYADSVNNGLVKTDTYKSSVRRETHGEIGEAHIVINYGSPGVRGRNIWGGLVGYDEVWVSGAHTATSITFESDVQINNTKVAAGTYAFFTIPGKKEWTLILNKNYNQHLADDYSDKEDVLRVVVKAQSVKNIVQRLTYTIDSKEGSTSGSISLMWEKIKVTLPVKSL
jgi:hypothetical protein